MKLSNLSSFLIGISAGAAIMLLFAPKSGKETRRYIRRRVDDGREFVERGTAKVQDIGDDLLDQAKQTMKRADRALTSAVEAGRSVASAIL